MRRWRTERDFATRSAEHAEASGQAPLAARRYLDAADQAAAAGGYERAVELLTRAVRLLDEAEPAAANRALRLSALMALGRIRWAAWGAGAESFSLPQAVVPLERAAAMLAPDDPVELHAELAQLLAQVYYDIGGPDELERALGYLVDARRALLDAGRPLEAARLLNDEAAVRLRRGEIERAGELLRRSHEMFARFADGNPVAQRELAETEQLMARLVLHAPAHEQQDPANLEFALARAEEAERAYERLGDSRERARVWETLARLERLLGRSDSAMQHLQAAVRVQRELGDALGMARSTAGLAELMADRGLSAEALSLLEDSVALNMHKGSLQGLAYNLRGLDELLARLSPAERAKLNPMAERLRSRVDAARARPAALRQEART
jgi:tetratricopeptide (TPR) repeat protein